MLIVGLLTLSVIIGVGIIVLASETERLRDERARHQAILAELRLTESRLAEYRVSDKERRQLREWWE